MCLHELATNAAKYGALSNQSGQVMISWQVSDSRIEVSWQEAGGPPVAVPKRKGFGTRLIETSFDQGASSIEFRPDGLRCQFQLSPSP